jgi:hypothetical protein
VCASSMGSTVPPRNTTDVVCSGSGTATSRHD